jgi:hypothetical protein
MQNASYLRTFCPRSYSRPLAPLALLLLLSTPLFLVPTSGSPRLFICCSSRFCFGTSSNFSRCFLLPAASSFICCFPHFPGWQWRFVLELTSHTVGKGNKGNADSRQVHAKDRNELNLGVAEGGKRQNHEAETKGESHERQKAKEEVSLDEQQSDCMHQQHANTIRCNKQERVTKRVQ